MVCPRKDPHFLAIHSPRTGEIFRVYRSTLQQAGMNQEGATRWVEQWVLLFAINGNIKQQQQVVSVLQGI